MKKLLIFLFVLIFLVVVAVGGGLAYAITNANAIAKQYKPQLEKLASDGLGSKVTFGDIAAKVFPTARLAITDAVIESGGEKLTLDSLALNVELMPLLQRELKVKELVLDTPKITIYLEKDGFYIAGLPREKPAAPAKPAAETKSAADAALPAEEITVTLDHIALKNATIALVDKTADETYVVKSIDVKAALAYENSMVKLGTLEGDMVMLEDVEVEFDGKNTTLNLNGGAFNIEEANAKALGNAFKVTGGIDPDNAKKALRITSDRVDLASLGPLYDAFAPGVNDLGIKGLCKPDLTVAWTSEGAYRANGTVGLSEASWTVADIPLTQIQGTLNLDATDKGAKVVTKDTKGLLREAPFTLVIDSGLKDKHAGLETVTAKVFEGTGTLNTGINLEGDMPFTTKLSLNDMKIEQVISALLPEDKSNISGTIKEMSGDISGTFNDKLMPSISGTAKMHLADGLVKDVNLGKEVLGGINNIPFIQGTLLNAVPEGMRDLIVNPHTALESVTATYAIANEQLKTEDLHVQSDYFVMDAKGTIGFDTKLDLAANIAFNKDFSAGLASMVKEINVLFDDQGRLAMPVKITGIPPDLKVMPDVGDLVKRAATGAIKQEATKQLEKAVGGEVGGLVDKFLGGNKKAPDGSAAPQSAAPQSATPQEDAAAPQAAPAPDGSATPPAETAPPTEEKPSTTDDAIKKGVESITNKFFKKKESTTPQ